MSLCDVCDKKEATMAVCQPRPSDPTELCSIMYVCESCEEPSFGTLDELIEAMKAGRTFVVKFSLISELEMSDRLSETGFLWLTV